MDSIWSKGKATAAEVQASLESPPSYSAIRALLAILVEKGHLRFVREGRRYVYEPTQTPESARRNALSRLLATFFDGSATQLVATLLDPKERAVPAAEARRIRGLITQLEKEERK